MKRNLSTYYPVTGQLMKNGKLPDEINILNPRQHILISKSIYRENKEVYILLSYAAVRWVN